MELKNNQKQCIMQNSFDSRINLTIKKGGCDEKKMVDCFGFGDYNSVF